MRVLGAILAGGQSRRFGSDKAQALLDGNSLFERVATGLREQTDGLVVCGRDWPGISSLADTAGAAGPLAGLSAALRHAEIRGFDAVLCAPIDVHPFPLDLRAKLAGTGPVVLETQYALGFWPARLREALDLQLERGEYRFRAWIRVSGAQLLPDATFGLRNINTVADLDCLAGRGC